MKTVDVRPGLFARLAQIVATLRLPAPVTFAMIVVLSVVASYAALIANSATISPAVRLPLVIGSASVAGVLTALQVIPSLARSAHGRHLSIVNPGTPLTHAPMQLPRDIHDFTGRSPELKWLTQVLMSERADSSAVVISAITGQGGVGKTVLALHAAHLAARKFVNGQIYVNLRGPEAEVLDPLNVLATLLRDLGVAPGAIPSELEDRSRLFRSILARMRVLIVLDNVSHESQVRPLLPGESSSKVLITSRTPLTGLDGIRSLRLGVMPEGEALHLLGEIIGVGRVTHEEAAARQLVKLCAFLPLAVRIAGGRLAVNPHGTIAALVDRLERQHNVLDYLQNGERAIRATLDVSYSGLDESAASLFRALGALTVHTFPEWLFPILSGDREEEALGALDALIRADMIESLGIDECGMNRYGFHDLLREYAREKLDASAGSETAFRHAVASASASYLRNALAADAVIRSAATRYNVFPHSTGTDITPIMPIRSFEDATSWFDSELSNILLLIEQVLECGLHGDAVSLADSLSAFCEERSRWREWEVAQRCAVAAAEATVSHERQCAAFHQLGRIHHFLGDWSEASREFDAALTIARTDHLDEYEAAALCAIGKINQLGRYDIALGLFEQARTIYESIGDRHAWAYVTAHIADVFHLRGEFERSIREFDLCMPIFRDLHDRWWEANAGIWLADVYRQQGEYEMALQRLQESLRVMRELGDERRAAVALVHIAIAHNGSGHARPALRAIGMAVPILERVADRWWLALASVEMGKAHVALKRSREALVCLQRSLPVIEEMGNERLLAEVNGHIAAIGE